MNLLLLLCSILQWVYRCVESVLGVSGLYRTGRAEELLQTELSHQEKKWQRLRTKSWIQIFSSKSYRAPNRCRTVLYSCGQSTFTPCIFYLWRAHLFSLWILFVKAAEIFFVECLYIRWPWSLQSAELVWKIKPFRF